MQARIKIAVMLMSMMFGTLAASAQSARRGTTHSEKQRSTSSSVHTKTRQDKHSAVKQRQPARATSSQKQHSDQRRSVSTTTRHNPRSTYQKPQTRSAVAKRSTHTARVEKPHRMTTAVTRVEKPRRTTTAVTRVEKPHRTTRHVATVEKPHHSHKVIRKNNAHRYYYPQRRVKMHVHPVTYRHNYRVMYYPSYSEIIWTRRMHRSYIDLYPGYYWNYPVGYRIQTISVFDARYNVGEISRVYGRVYGTWFNKETDDLLLFFGGQYPNQEFTLIVPGHIARRFSWRPERYFLGQHIVANGLIDQFEGRPEMIIKKKRQLDVY